MESNNMRYWIFGICILLTGIMPLNSYSQKMNKYIAKGDFEKAEAICAGLEEEALCNCYTQLADVYTANNYTEKAAGFYEKAADMYYKKHDYDKARGFYEKAYAGDQKKLDAIYLKIAKEYVNSEKFEKAEQYAEYVDLADLYKKHALNLTSTSATMYFFEQDANRDRIIKRVIKTGTQIANRYVDEQSKANEPVDSLKIIDIYLDLNSAFKSMAKDYTNEAAKKIASGNNAEANRESYNAEVIKYISEQFLKSALLSIPNDPEKNKAAMLKIAKSAQ